MFSGVFRVGDWIDIGWNVDYFAKRAAYFTAGSLLPRPVLGKITIPDPGNVPGPDSVLDAVGEFVLAWANQTLDAPGESVFNVPVQVLGPEANIPMVPSPQPQAVVPQAAYLPDTTVINPGYDTEGTIYEEPLFEPGNEWYARTGETDWAKVYDEWVILNQPKEEPVFDWLESATTLGQLGTAVGWWGGDSGLVAAPPVVQPGGPSGMPAKVTVDTRTGKITKCKRRRRRKLLTESDFNVLLRVATLPNKENVRIVLGKAIGR